MASSSLNKNIALLTKLESYIELHQKLNETISGETIGWHIAHSCQVINTITNAIVHSDASKAKPKFSFLYHLIMLTNHIPRGKVKAPNIVIPKNTITKAEIVEEIELAKANLQTLASAGQNKYFTHPIFGDLDVPKTLKFFAVHSNHHLKIIRDIH
jgi:hypothetical protein